MDVQYWKVNCMEHRYPGLWQYWFLHQVVALGWPPGWGYRLDGTGVSETGWNIARSALDKVKPGDKVVVALRDHRVGRVGTVTERKVADTDWNPTVPPGPGLPHGEQGRLIEVRWNMTRGPERPDMVVRLPGEGANRAGLNGAKLRLTLCRLDAHTFRRIEKAMDDEANWESVLPTFDRERALSEFIVAYPHRLEGGLVPYPSQKAREKVFRDGTRADVLLRDHDGNMVVVECKQRTPTVSNIRQLRGYMRNAANLPHLTARKVRGMLVHGGARKLPAAVRREALRKPQVELVQHNVTVSFARSS